MKDLAQSASPSRKRICLVGTGSIAHAHAEAIQKNPGLLLTAVVDTDGDKARQFAARWGVEHVYTRIDEALERQHFDRAHIAVPPSAHASATLPLLEASIPSFVEKPLASTSAEANRLVETSEGCGTPIGVNQNAIFHPAFRKLMKHMTDGEIGPLQHVDCMYHMPLRQLAARQFSHWMFSEPKNILLEQAVHPLSQVLSLVGPAVHVEAIAAKCEEIAPGIAFYSSCNVMLQNERAPALIRFAVGTSYPVWQIRVIGTEGTITADMVRNHVVVSRRSRWLDAADDLVTGVGAAWQIGAQSIVNAMRYGASAFGLTRRTDPFFLSMTASIEAFHDACDAKRPASADGVFGLELVSLCERIAQTAFQPTPTSPKAVPRGGNRHDIAVLGGTGFIGRAVVSRLLEEQPDLHIGVMSRNLANLSEVFHEDRVQLIAGNVTSVEDVSNAIDSARIVINLAHGGGGDTWSEIERRMVGSARTVASLCLSQKAELLIHIGSIAGLYLGEKSDVITGRTLPDPQPLKRAPYARAKAMADALLMGWHQERGLPVCILRPAIVVGEGASPFHSGLGFFNNEQHCMGWNEGRNPLPFVLVEDVADAIVRAALRPELSGRSLNLVGDVTMSAREYINELGLAIGRPLQFHGQRADKLYLVEWGKWVVKRLAGRKDALPSYRDLRSRGCLATFDCSDAKAALSWAPVSQRKVFIDKAIRVHAAATQDA